MATDHDRGGGGQPVRGRQPGPVRQPQVQRRAGLRERPGGRALAGTGGQERDELHQLGVTVGDRRTPHQASVDPFQPHPVSAGDDDVLHVRVIDQRLQPAEPEHRVEHRSRERVLLARGPRLVPGPHRLRGGLVQHLEDHHPAQFLLRLRVEPAGDRTGQAFGHLRAEAGHQRPVHTHPRLQAGRQFLRPHQAHRGIRPFSGAGVLPGRTNPAGTPPGRQVADRQ